MAQEKPAVTPTLSTLTLNDGHLVANEDISIPLLCADIAWIGTEALSSFAGSPFDRLETEVPNDPTKRLTVISDWRHRTAPYSCESQVSTAGFFGTLLLEIHIFWKRRPIFFKKTSNKNGCVGADPLSKPLGDSTSMEKYADGLTGSFWSTGRWALDHWCSLDSTVQQVPRVFWWSHFSVREPLKWRNYHLMKPM